MNWTAIVPLRTGGEPKSRLTPIMSTGQREALAAALADHVLRCLEQASQVSRIVVLSPTPFTRSGVDWRRDEGAGLNAELVRACRDLSGPRLIIHGDLPLLTADDVTALTKAAERAGVALAPDRHETGTNAVATQNALVYAFGERSYARHLELAGPHAAIVRRAGLAHDIDTPEDFAAAVAAGWRAPGSA